MEVIFGELPSSGSGYGYGYGYYWKAAISTFAEKWPAAQRIRLKTAQDQGAHIAYWLSNTVGCACNGGQNQPVKVGDIEKSEGPLSLCERGTLHATLLPTKWRGERWWVVALHGEVIGDDEKLGALQREIIGECL